MSDSIRASVADETVVHASSDTEEFKGSAVLHVYCGQDKTWKQATVLTSALCTKFIDYNDTLES